MQAVGIYVIVEPKRGETRKSNVGLDIPTELIDRFLSGSVVSVSKEVQKDFGIESGMEVLYDKNAGHEFTGMDGKRYKLVTCRDIAIIL